MIYMLSRLLRRRVIDQEVLLKEYLFGCFHMSLEYLVLGNQPVDRKFYFSAPESEPQYLVHCKETKSYYAFMKNSQVHECMEQ